MNIIDAKTTELKGTEFAMVVFRKDIQKHREANKRLEEDYLNLKQAYDDAQVSIDKLQTKLKEIESETKLSRGIIDDLKSKRLKQRDDFIMMQAKAKKMSNSLKSLVTNINTYLEENKLLKKQLERTEKRHYLGFLDMTPRPNYREIFNRRQFTHYKEDLPLKIAQQHFSTSDVIEELIDMIKAIESKSHFVKKDTSVGDSGQIMKNLEHKNTIISRVSTMNNRKNRSRIQEVSGADGLTIAQKSSRRISRRVKENVASGSLTPRSNLVKKNTQVEWNSTQALRKQLPGSVFRDSGVPSQARSRSASSKNSSSMDSMISKLTQKNYDLVRDLEKGMEEINKDFNKLVMI